MRLTPAYGRPLYGKRLIDRLAVGETPAVVNPAYPVTQYKAGLGLLELGSFTDHEGFDGVMLGTPGAGYHLEFTFCRAHAVAPPPTAEDLLVFYIPDRASWEGRCRAMLAAGFEVVAPYNPYWQRLGRTYEDQDGYRVVIQQAEWQGNPLG